MLEAVLNVTLIASSVCAITGVSALAYAYRASLISADPATRLFAWGMALFAASVFLRRFTWDIWWPVITGEIDQRPVNVTSNLLAILAVYLALRSRLALVPRVERHRWRWWNCWAHPHPLRLRAVRPDFGDGQ
ncbi:MAG: hypothetical protein Q4G49_04145 [Paracoccus sp. (in: a-proteobacteria)]|nr:hypothetical protein [Paracoccus sp. (in: a-proteobacteria)]